MTIFGWLLIGATTLIPLPMMMALPNVGDQIALFSQYLGMSALILMAWAQIMATRLPGVETVFGSLDQVYVLHKWTGIIAMTTMLAHDTIDAEMDGLGPNTVLIEFGETLGEISLYGLLILAVISVATFIPYHLWKWTHKAMGALFAAGALHFMLIQKPFDLGDPVGLYVLAFCLAGVGAYLFTLIPERLRIKRRYKITDVSHTGGATAVTFAPQGRPLRHKSGQFGVVSFPDSGLAEPHPFSFSAPPRADGTLRITVKPLGDYTYRLQRKLEVGQSVRVQGPFGRFTRQGRKPQVWIAGGVGITPFLARAADLPADAAPVELFWCVRTRADAPHLAELEALVANTPNLTLHLIASGDGQRLTAEHIATTAKVALGKAKVSFCGPASLRQAMQTGLAMHGVTSRNFHFEAFEFRTGVGLERLAAVLLNRALGLARQRGMTFSK